MAIQHNNHEAINFLMNEAKLEMGNDVVDSFLECGNKKTVELVQNNRKNVLDKLGISMHERANKWRDDTTGITESEESREILNF